MTAIQLSLLGGQQEARTTDDYYTPRWIFDTMGITFDLDVACPPEGSINVPAARYYTAADDGLAQPWEGRVWMNPPYSKTAPWVRRWLDHANGIALLPCVKESRWVHDLWASEAKVVWINADPIKFWHKEKEQHILTIVWLWALGDDCIEAISRLGRPR